MTIIDVAKHPFENGKCPMCGGSLVYLADYSHYKSWRCTQCEGHGCEDKTGIVPIHTELTNALGQSVVLMEPDETDELPELGREQEEPPSSNPELNRDQEGHSMTKTMPDTVRQGCPQQELTDNASDLISVEEAKKTARRIFSDEVLIYAIDTTLNKTPVIAAKPVKYGKMVERIVDHECPWHTVWECSLCNSTGASWYNFCPNYGAIMHRGVQQ